MSYLEEQRAVYLRREVMLGLPVCGAAVGGLGGFGMAPTAYTGIVASLGFTTMGVCWLTCTQGPGS